MVREKPCPHLVTTSYLCRYSWSLIKTMWQKNLFTSQFVGQTPPNQVTNEPIAQKKYSEHPLNCHQILKGKESLNFPSKIISLNEFICIKS